jgi:hypothetical protein
VKIATKSTNRVSAAVKIMSQNKDLSVYSDDDRNSCDFKLTFGYINVDMLSSNFCKSEKLMHTRSKSRFFIDFELFVLMDEFQNMKFPLSICSCKIIQQKSSSIVVLV